jgi:hypothetical protein
MSSPAPTIDPGQLTEILRRAGVIGGGRVSDIRVDDFRSTILSQIGRLHLTYEGPAEGAPASLFLKMGLPERRGAWWGYRHEVDFYAKVADRIPHGVVPRCYEAHFDEATGESRLLIEDLTETHELRTL